MAGTFKALIFKLNTLFMKISNVCLLLLCSLLYSATLQAQLAVVEYMKVKPGMWEKYLECEQAYKIIHQERVEKGYILSWQLDQVLFPSGANTEYDFITVTEIKDLQALETVNDHWDELIEGAPADQLELLSNADDYRTLVKREVWEILDYVPTPGDQRPKYILDNYMRVPAGGWQAYVEMESKFVKPIHEKSAAAGNRAGWLLAAMVLPQGDDFAYQASAVDFFHTLPDMTNDNSPFWKEVYPNMSDEEIGKRIESARTVAKRELRVIVDYTE